MHHQHQAPVIVTDRFPAEVSVVTVHISGRSWGVVSRTAAAQPERHAEIMRALTAAGVEPRHIREVLDGLCN